jgi:7-alpha-hydroxysteroid dehydrogenase
MVLDEFRLDGNIALLAGCGRNWVRDLALALAEAGAKVVVPGSGEQIESENRETGTWKGGLIDGTTKPTSAREIHTVVRQTMSRFGRIDILVNHFNLEFGKPFLDCPYCTVKLSESTWCEESRGRSSILSQGEP